MAWDTEYALDGFFMFGAPLNVVQYVIDPDDNQFGASTDAYWVTHFLLDEEISVIARLIALAGPPGPIVYFPITRLLRRSSASVGGRWVMEQQFFNAWLYSFTSDFYDPRNPGIATAGQVLGLACNRADNLQIHPKP